VSICLWVLAHYHNQGTWILFVNGPDHLEEHRYGKRGNLQGAHFDAAEAFEVC